MKKILMIIVLSAVSSSLWAEYGRFGAGIMGFIHNDREISPTDIVTKDNRFEAMPFFSLMLNEELELASFLVFGFDTTKVDGNVTDRDIAIGIGSGLYWHFVRRDHFRLGTGANLEINYEFMVEDPILVTDTDFRIKTVMPLFADIVLNDTFVFRVNLDMLQFQLRFTESDPGTGETRGTNFDIVTYNILASTNFGLILRFG